MSAIRCVVPLACVLSGCASTMPDVDIGYYLPKAQTKLTVVHAFACNADNTNHVVASGATAATTYESDFSRGRKTVPLKRIIGTANSGSASFTLTDDGRLSGINTSSTGAGEDIVKGILSIAKTVATLGEKQPKDPLCEHVVKAWGEKGVVSVTLTATFNPTTLPAVAQLSPDPASMPLKIALNSVGIQLPDILLEADNGQEVDAGTVASASGQDNSSQMAMLTLSRVRRVALHAYVNRDKSADILNARLLVPFAGSETNSERTIPIPQAPFFGGQTFVLALSDAGTVTTLTYGKESGTAAGLNTFNAAMAAFTPKSAADKAAEIQAKADLIAQTQRLAACEASPKDCK